MPSRRVHKAGGRGPAVDIMQGRCSFFSALFAGPRFDLKRAGGGGKNSSYRDMSLGGFVWIEHIIIILRTVGFFCCALMSY